MKEKNETLNSRFRTPRCYLGQSTQSRPFWQSILGGIAKELLRNKITHAGLGHLTSVKWQRHHSRDLLGTLEFPSWWIHRSRDLRGQGAQDRWIVRDMRRRRRWRCPRSLRSLVPHWWLQTLESRWKSWMELTSHKRFNVIMRLKYVK